MKGKGGSCLMTGEGGKDVGTEDSTGGSDSDTVMETKTAVEMWSCLSLHMLKVNEGYTKWLLLLGCSW